MSYAARQKYKQPCYPTKSEDSLELLGGDLALSGVSDLICWKLRTDPELLELTDGADWPEVSVALRRVLEVVFNGEVWPPLNVSKDIVDGIEFDHFVQSVVEASKRPLPLGEDTLAASVESLLEEDTGRNVDKRVIRFYEHIRGLAVAPPPSSPDPDAAHATVATYPSISEASSGLRSAASSSGSGGGSGGGSVQEQEDAFDRVPRQHERRMTMDVVDEIDANEVASNSGIDDEDDLDLKFDSFDELLLDEAAQEETVAVWREFRSRSKTQASAGELIYAALAENAAAVQATFTAQKDVMGNRLEKGLDSCVMAMHSPAKLKQTVEALAFQHLMIDASAPRVFLFRGAMLDLLSQELGQLWTKSAYRGWQHLLTYIGGAIIYVKSHYADRIKLLLSSWAVANKKGDDTADAQVNEDDDDEDWTAHVSMLAGDEQGKKIGRWAEVKARVKSTKAKVTSRMSRRVRTYKDTTTSFESQGGTSGEQMQPSGETMTMEVSQGGSEGDSEGSRDEDEAGTFKANNTLLGASVPTTYTEMFEFSATVMGFAKTRWLYEVNASFSDMVKNIGNASRVQEECEVLALRISKSTGGRQVNLAEYRSIMLAALRSMLPKTWDQDHETAWNWLWENIERLLKDVLYKPPVWEPALAQLMAEICEEDRAELNNNVYTRFFQVAPQGQDFFKQSNTRLQFIASRVALMVGELFADPWKMTEEISAVGLRHVGYGIPTDLVGPFVSVCIEVLEAFAPEKTSALEAYRWGLSLIAKILNRVINEGSTVVMKAINANSASLLRRAVACAPRGERAVWLLRIQVGTQRISPLSWAIESGSFSAARAMLEDLLTIRADRERYYYGIDHLFENHPDIIERLCVDAPSLLNTLLHGLGWRSRRTVNGLRRVNFFVKYLLVTAEGRFAKALDAFAQANDVKIISHPVLVLISDTLWAGVVRRQFIVSKLDFLFSLLVFMLCQAILPKLGNESNKGLAWSILVGRTMNYVFNFARLFGIHTKCFFRAYRTGDTTKVAGVPLPTTYLQDQDGQMSILLLLSLILMCISEPFYYCLPSISSTGPTEECDAAQPVIGRYIIFSMSAMVLHWLLLVDMSVFSTGLAAFVLVCRHVISEVGKFLVAMVFLLLTFASAISCLKHNSKELDSVLGAANCLFALTVGLYEGDYRDFLLDPTLLIPVLIFVTLSAILLINLLIAQLNCSYDYVYADMLGFARLSRAALIVDTMSSCPAGRFTKFVAGLRFQKLLEFDEGDVGLGGGIQTREFANLNPISVDTIRRFGGASSPQMQWPEEEGDEEDKMVRIQKLLVLINKEASASEKVEKRLQRKSKDRATVASTVDGAIHSRASAGQSSLGEEPKKSGISNPSSGSEGH